MENNQQFDQSVDFQRQGASVVCLSQNNMMQGGFGYSRVGVEPISMYGVNGTIPHRASLNPIEEIDAAVQ